MSGEVTLWNTSYGDYTDKEPEPCGCDADPDHGPHHRDGTRIRKLIALPAAEFEAWRRVVEAALHLCRNQLPHRLGDLPDAVRALPSARKEGSK